MTQSEPTVRQIFAGDDSATPLAFVIPYFNSSDIFVESELDGTTTALVNGVDYTIAGGGGNGGTVTPLAAIASGTNWVIYRSLPRTQPIDFENQDTILPSAIEEGIDRVTLMLMEETDEASRSIKADSGEINPTGLSMPDLASRAEQLLKWDANGEIGAISPDEVFPDDITTSAWGRAWVNMTSFINARQNLRIYVGLLENIDQAPTDVTCLYFSFDTLEVFVYDGADWLLMSASQATTVKPNLIINGSAQINQRVTCNAGSTFPNTDFSFCLDHVLFLGAGPAAIVEQSTDAPDGSSHSFKLTSALNNQKFGLLFPLDSLKSAALFSAGDDKVCSVRFKYKASSEVDNIRMMVLAFDGTVDELNDPINAWGASGGEPNFTSDWSRESDASANIPVSESWQTKEVTNIAIDKADAKNVALFIWVDDTDLVATTDIIYLADVQLNEGPALAPYVRPTFSEEYNECIRFFRKTFSYTQEPGTNRGTDGALVDVFGGWYNDIIGVCVQFEVPMAKEPDVVTYNPGADNALWRNLENAADVSVASVDFKGDSGFTILARNTSNIEHGDDIGIHYTAIAEIIP
jgi:hypothetical protein